VQDESDDEQGDADSGPDVGGVPATEEKNHDCSLA
jgi:hypothetical protein